MNLSSTSLDKAAIAISLVCTAHCLLLPLALVLLPILTGSLLSDEGFHRWLLLAVIPTSILALTLGCRRHGHYSVMIGGALGLLLLSAAVTMGHDFLGETGEKLLTVIGTACIVWGHWRNYRLCQGQDCHCDKHA